MVKPRSSSAGLNLRTASNGGNPGSGGRLSRAMSFKHPERMGQIPPMEITREAHVILILDTGFILASIFHNSSRINLDI